MNDYRSQDTTMSDSAKASALLGAGLGGAYAGYKANRVLGPGVVPLAALGGASVGALAGSGAGLLMGGGADVIKNQMFDPDTSHAYANTAIGLTGGAALGGTLNASRHAISNKPILKGGLIGAGLGAGAGAISGLGLGLMQDTADYNSRTANWRSNGIGKQAYYSEHDKPTFGEYTMKGLGYGFGLGGGLGAATGAIGGAVLAPRGFKGITSAAAGIGGGLIGAVGGGALGTGIGGVSYGFARSDYRNRMAQQAREQAMLERMQQEAHVREVMLQKYAGAVQQAAPAVETASKKPGFVRKWGGRALLGAGLLGVGMGAGALLNRNKNANYMDIYLQKIAESTQIVPYTGGNTQIVPYTGGNTQIVPYTGGNTQIVPYTGGNTQTAPATNTQTAPATNTQTAPATNTQTTSKPPKSKSNGGRTTKNTTTTTTTTPAPTTPGKPWNWKKIGIGTGLVGAGLLAGSMLSGGSDRRANYMDIYLSKYADDGSYVGDVAKDTVKGGAAGTILGAAGGAGLGAATLGAAGALGGAAFDWKKRLVPGTGVDGVPAKFSRAGGASRWGKVGLGVGALGGAVLGGLTGGTVGSVGGGAVSSVTSAAKRIKDNSKKDESKQASESYNELLKVAQSFPSMSGMKKFHTAAESEAEYYAFLEKAKKG